MLGMGSTATLAMVLIILIFSYLIRIQDLYFKETHPSFFLFLLAMKLRRVNIDEMSHTEIFTEIVSERRLINILEFPRATGVQRTIKSLKIQYDESFLRTLPDINFIFFYGLCQIIAYRWVHAPPLTRRSTRVGFGQLVPLLLLFLPVLAAGETFYGR
jgi:hypothetical protein